MQTRTHKLSSRLRGHRGQAFVEFAIVLPVLVMLLVGIAQFGLAFHNYLSITDATRVGARAAAVKRTADPCGVAKSAILGTISLKQQSKIVFPAGWCTAGLNTGEPVKLTVKYAYSIGLPGFSAGGDLTATATERLE